MLCFLMGRTFVSWTANLLLLTISIATVLGICEVGFRVRAHWRNQQTWAHAFESLPAPPTKRPSTLVHLIQPSLHPHVIYELRPNLSTRYNYDSTVRINEHGFRGPSYPQQKSPGTFRILGLGDSSMFGNGVSEGEPYPHRLMAMLRQWRPERGWEFINTAAPGYNTVMEVAMLEHKGLSFEPDLILIDFVPNDMSLPNFIRVDERPWGLHKSFLWEYAAGALATVPSLAHLPGRREPVGLEALDPGLIVAVQDGQYERNPDKVPAQYRYMVGFDAYSTAMRRLAEIGDEHGIPILRMDSLPMYGFGSEKLAVASLAPAQESGMHVLDLRPAVEDAARKSGYDNFRESPLGFGKRDSHLSALGHEVVAKGLFEHLTQTGLVPGGLP